MQDFYSMIGFCGEAHATAPLDSLEEPGPDTALFLDFDGTLVDIAEKPDRIAIPSHLPDTLKRLCRRHGGAVAIISGRDIVDLGRHLPGFSGAIAGGHGAQMRLPGGDIVREPVDIARIAALQNAASAFALSEPSVHVEFKDAGVVLHYRSAPEMEEKVRRFAHGLVDDDPDFTCQGAKMAVEIKPYGVNKGRAIERLMRTRTFAGRIPLFAGDDRTDETGFEAVNEAGGITIKIGEGQTEAQHRAATPAQFRKWLSQLAGGDA